MAADDKATSLNVSLPESLKAFVEEQVASGGYVSASEFIRQLLREARESRARKDELETLLAEGLESGDPLEVTTDYWAQKRKALDEKR